MGSLCSSQDGFRFLGSGSLRSEWGTTHQEAYFVELRKKLFLTKGWKCFRRQIKEGVVKKLLCGWEDPWLDQLTDSALDRTKQKGGG